MRKNNNCAQKLCCLLSVAFILFVFSGVTFLVEYLLPCVYQVPNTNYCQNSCCSSVCSSSTNQCVPFNNSPYSLIVHSVTEATGGILVLLLGIYLCCKCTSKQQTEQIENLVDDPNPQSTNKPTAMVELPNITMTQSPAYGITYNIGRNQALIHRQSEMANQYINQARQYQSRKYNRIQ